MSYSIEYRVFENSYFGADEQWVTHSMKAGLTLKQADSQMYELDDCSFGLHRLQRRIVDSSGKIVAIGRHNMENTNIFRVESFENSRWRVETSNLSLDDAIAFVNSKDTTSPKLRVVLNQNTYDKIYYGFHTTKGIKLILDAIQPTKEKIKLADIPKIHEAYTRLESLPKAVENLHGNWISKAEITLISTANPRYLADQKIEIEHSVLLPILESEIKQIELSLKNYGVSLC